MELQRIATNLVHKWCTRWDIPEPVVIEDQDKGFGYHETDDGKYVIGINPELTESHMVMNILLHELRHHYQSIKYPKLYEWWSDNIHLYEFFYKSPICVIEEDANIFAWTNGKKNAEILFPIITQSYVNQAFKEITSQRKSFIEYCNEIQKIEIANGISDWKARRREITGKSKWNHEYILSLGK